jgi:hypothetical protein
MRQSLISVFASDTSASTSLGHEHVLLYMLAIPALVPSLVAAYSVVGSGVAGRLPGIFEEHALVGPETTRFRRRPARCGRTALVAIGLVQPHSRDLSTSTSQPGEDGSKPCSISQRTACRLRSDHHARITSRSTSVP